jgi:hypothetical protein
MKRQPRIDDATWKLFIRACGGVCCECGRDKKLEQGHIQRHVDGGQLVFENLIPLCKSCNAKHCKGFTRDSRPTDWRDAFFKLFMAANGVALGWQQPKPDGNHLPPGQNAETTGFIDLKNVKFVAKSSYITTCADTPTAQPMSERVARDLLWEIFEKSKECAIRPKRPLRKRQDELKLLAIRNGRDNFRLAGEQFLRESPCPWVAGDEGRGGYAQADSWQHLCESFDAYVTDGRARLVRVAQQAEADLKEAEIGKERNRVARWRDYIRGADVPPWPDMKEDDRQFLLTVASEKAAGGCREVSDENLSRSYAIYRRHKFVTLEALLEEKVKLREQLVQCAKWAKQLDEEKQKEVGSSIKQYSACIDSAKDIAALSRMTWGVSVMFQNLDPNEPEQDLAYML